MFEAFDVVLSCVEDEMTLFSKRERKGAVTGILLKSMVVGQNLALCFLQLCFLSMPRRLEIRDGHRWFENHGRFELDV